MYRQPARGLAREGQSDHSSRNPAGRQADLARVFLAACLDRPPYRAGNARFPDTVNDMQPMADPATLQGAAVC
jgi:hypothetical protein